MSKCISLQTLTKSLNHMEYFMAHSAEPGKNEATGIGAGLIP